MPKKKQPRNAFYFFMLDIKEGLEKEGRRIEGGMREVANVAGPKWAVLSADVRLFYEEKAAEYKFKDKNNLENKYTTMGISYAQCQAEEKEKTRLRIRMMKEIVETIQHLDRDTTLKTHTFYFVHFNYYCRIDDGKYLVCEVAIAKFNLEGGVKDVFHTLIRHDKIPTGFSFEAKSTSEETHQIPLPQDLTEGEHWERGFLFHSIKTFLEQDSVNGELPPLYTILSHVEIAQSSLTLLAELSYPQNPDIFRVYPLSMLFFYLRNAAALPGSPGFPIESLAERELDKDLYNFAPSIACNIHENCDTCVYCSKSIVTRWAFLICDHCCYELRIPIIPGKHVPINADVKEFKFEKPDVDEDGFVFVPRRGAKVSAAWASAPPTNISKDRPKQEIRQIPFRVTDFGKTGPPEDTAHHYNLNAASASPPSRSVGNCWGAKPDVAPLRHPTRLPTFVQNALSFTEEDFPGLGSRNRGKTPAAVAGRGRGRARILQEEIKTPGGLRSDVEGESFQVIGRGRVRTDGKPGSRLAANLQGFQFK